MNKKEWRDRAGREAARADREADQGLTSLANALYWKQRATEAEAERDQLADRVQVAEESLEAAQDSDDFYEDLVAAETRAASWWEAAKEWCRSFNQSWELVNSLTDDNTGLLEQLARAEHAKERSAQLDKHLSAALSREAKLKDQLKEAEAYPTVDAYENVCAARTRWQERAEKAEARAESLRADLDAALDVGKEADKRLARLQLAILDKLGDLINGAACDDDYIRAVELHSGRGLLREAAEWQGRAKKAEADLAAAEDEHARLIQERDAAENLRAHWKRCAESAELGAANRAPGGVLVPLRDLDEMTEARDYWKERAEKAEADLRESEIVVRVLRCRAEGAERRLAETSAERNEWKSWALGGLATSLQQARDGDVRDADAVEDEIDAAKVAEALKTPDDTVPFGRRTIPDTVWAKPDRSEIGSLRSEVSDLRDEVAHIDGVLTQLAEGFQQAVTGEGSE
ncbi:coiled-coil domain-containing protein [Saccharopolyspora mangrovi]|uniref:Uncharacterized protein n=1 Tax=Saccharopolyspora mangrovi TaxID=3082379 RepID=A0ABU6A749_9PSEU|nr:hypothetical protein [Saccharopolyspora sp. S2-29]MEB3367387.1 hypothetical protein [Saccharopolyspora sp. S2-29]